VESRVRGIVEGEVLQAERKIRNTTFGVGFDGPPSPSPGQELVIVKKAR
jgi:hypothetical protein